MAAAVLADGLLLREALWALAALVLVCLLAAVVLRLLARQGVGRPKGGSPRLRVLERLTLSPRRTLYLVRAQDRVLLIGAGDGAELRCLTVWADSEVDGPAAPAPGRKSSAEAVEPLRG